MAQATAVVLDQDQTERDDIRIRLSHCGVLPICFKDEWMCLENIHHIKPSFAVLRTNSYQQAFRFVNLVKAIKSIFPVIVLSNQNDIERFIRNNWLVNLFFLRYPADDKEFQGTIALLSTMKHERHRPVLVAGSPERKRLIQGLPLLGLSKEPILVQGERGVGKKQVARVIHSYSAAKERALDFIDAGHISGQWIRDNRPRTDSIDRDTAGDHVSVIENIENLSSALQSQLLSVMEGFNGNGIGEGENGVSAPFITLAGCDLESLATTGKFRKDLYHRLSVFRVKVPPLRGHSDDICAMAEFFAAQYSIRFNGSICRLPDRVLAAFDNYHWPGNVSELKGTTRRMITAGKNIMGTNPLPLNADDGMIKHGRRPSDCFIDKDEVHNFLEKNRDATLRQVKKRYITQVEIKILKAALAQTNGNCKKAAGLLDISYKSMLNKAKAYRLV